MNGPWLQTYTGGMWEAERPETYSYDIKEIAHALSHVCRFAGHTREFYSVAQHSVVVYELVRGVAPSDIVLQLAALLHDAAEAYCLDVPSPIKGMPMMREYRAWMGRTETTIAHQYGCYDDMHSPTIKRADLIALATERRDLMTLSNYHDMWIGGLPEPREARIEAWSSTVAKERFLHAWEQVSYEPR